MKVAKWGGIGILAFVYACGGGSSVTGNAGTTGIGASPSLNITVAGGGTVTSPDGSINCSATCSQSSTVGAAVHLDAAPAAGMQFMGWSGACSGTGGCDLIISGLQLPIELLGEVGIDRCLALLPRRIGPD